MLSDDEIVEAVNCACSRLAYKFKFGYHEVEDMKQYAYTYALGAIQTGKWDGERPLKNFIYVHIHNQFYNFKRKHYHRLATPCEKCPLSAYKADTDTCLAYEQKEYCKWYSAWIQRNESKKSLMHSVEMSPMSHPCTPESDEVESTDYLNWVEQNLPPEFRKTWDLARQGERVNSANYREMIKWVRENVVL